MVVPHKFFPLFFIVLHNCDELYSFLKIKLIMVIIVLIVFIIIKIYGNKRHATSINNGLFCLTVYFFIIILSLVVIDYLHYKFICNVKVDYSQEYIACFQSMPINWSVVSEVKISWLTFNLMKSYLDIHLNLDS